MARRPSLSEQLDEYERTCEIADAARLGRDHWLVSGRIDGIREALETMRSGISRNEVERILEERVSKLMNQT